MAEEGGRLMAALFNAIDKALIGVIVAIILIKIYDKESD